MRRILPLFVLVLIAFTACKKESTNNVYSDILVRVENNTSAALIQVNSCGTNYGDLQSHAVSGYQHYDEVVAFPGATFTISEEANVHAGMGYCGTPPLPYLEKGKYTLRIYEDANIYSGYNAVFEKE